MLKLLPFVLIFFSCGMQKKTDSKSLIPTKENTNSETEKIYFNGAGNEPFWSLSISNKKISFKCLDESYNLELNHVSPKYSEKNEYKVYTTKSEGNILVVTITKRNCSDTMSDIDHAFGVKVEVKKNVMTKAVVFNGCGNYVLNYRLQDIWILESIDEAKIKKSNTESAFIEINVTDKSFKGNSGCNVFSGKLIPDENNIAFTKIISTFKACPENLIENKFIALLQTMNNYKLENNRLLLKNQTGNSLVFKKGD